MDPLSILGIAGSNILGGLFNFISNSDANSRAQALQDQNLQNFINIAIPDPQEQQVALQQFVNQGTLTPAFQQAIQQNPTEFNNIITNVGYKQAQNNALNALSNIGQQGGMTLQDQATLNNALNQSNVQARSDRDAIAAQMAQRGIQGGGLDVAARLASQQNQADRDANSSLQTASDAQSRALQAIMDSGQLAGQYATQDYNQQSQRAQAQEAINRFNSANLQNVANNNIAAQNAAQVYNLGQKQNIANLNTNLANQQQLYNKSLPQQQFNDQLAKAQGMSGIYANQGNLAQAQGQNAGNFFSNLGATGAQAIGSFAQEAKNNPLSSDSESPPATTDVTSDVGSSDWWNQLLNPKKTGQVSYEGGVSVS